MRTLPALLLLLVLPGLLLPAGFVLRLCRCASAEAHAAATPTVPCCATPAATSATSAAAPCCQRGCCGTPAGDQGPGCQAGGGDCTCVWRAPAHKPDPAPLGHAPDLPVALPARTALTVPGPGADTFAQRWHAAESRPPPPDRHRSLPLLL